MKTGRALLCCICVYLSCASADADLTMTLQPSTQLGPRGTEIVFSGTLTNTGATKLFLNDIHPIVGAAASPYLTVESNFFYANVPGILLHGETYSNSELFRVLLSGIAPAGDYGGTIFLTGGADILANSDLASSAFVVSAPWKIVSLTHLTNGHVVLQCFGVPNTANSIQAAPDLFGSFTPLASVMADANGAFQYEDTNPDNLSIRFYQLVFP